MKKIIFLLLTSLIFNPIKNTYAKQQNSSPLARFTETSCKISENSEKEFIASLAKVAIQNLSGTSLTEKEKQDNFRKLFEANFATNSIAKFVLGRYKNRANSKELSEYTELFIKHIIRVYAGYLDKHNEEDFTVTRTAENKKGGIWVLSKIKRPQAAPINVKWLVFKDKEGNTYKIYDVVVDGISMSVTQRSEYSAIIQKNGGTVKGLINTLKKKTSATS